MIKIFTDGSSRGNPGPGGYGVVMLYKGNRKELSQGYKITTNNRMELTAVIKALEAIKTNNIKVTIYSDSKYVVESIEKGWIWNWEKKNFKKKQNIDLWKQFIPLYKKFNIKFVWVKGHAGIKENERSDEPNTQQLASGKNPKLPRGPDGAGACIRRTHPASRCT